MPPVKSIDSNEIAYVSVEGDRVLLDIEDTEEVCLQCSVFSKEAAQALGTALLAAASNGGTEHALCCRWDGRKAVVSMTRELSGERWVAVDGGVFNASEAKALLAAIASCVAAVEAANGGDGDGR